MRVESSFGLHFSLSSCTINITKPLYQFNFFFFDFCTKPNSFFFLFFFFFFISQIFPPSPTESRVKLFFTNLQLVMVVCTLLKLSSLGSILLFPWMGGYHSSMIVYWLYVQTQTAFKLYYSLLVNSNKSFKQSVPLFSHLWKRESSTIYFIGLFWENSIKWFNLKDLTQYLPQLLFNNNSVGTLNYYSSFFLFHSWSVCKTGHWYAKQVYLKNKLKFFNSFVQIYMFQT